MSGKWKIKADKDCLIVNSPTAPQGWVSITGMVGQYHRNTQIVLLSKELIHRD
jgi:hypothetical protein